MRFAVPPPHLQALAYSGLTLPPDAALQRGLVDAIVDAERIDAEAIAVAEALAAVPPTAFALTKRLLREPVLERIHVGAALDALAQEAWTSAEVLDAIRAYVARTLGPKT
jgi:enoyl-CoA hydratase/carnithine racemase